MPQDKSKKKYIAPKVKEHGVVRELNQTTSWRRSIEKGKGVREIQKLYTH